MEISYKRSMGCSYMILQEQENDSGNSDSYQMHIFLENQIAGLLPCRIQKINGEELFYYEITGYQNIVHLFEKNKLCRQDLENLFLDVVKIIETLDAYLMERNRLILNPSYIYQNMETGKYMFTWFLYSKRTLEGEFRSLTEYILPKINHEDKAAVTIGYGVYRVSMEDYMDTDIIRQQIFSGREDQKEEKSGFCNEEYNQEEEWRKEKQRQRILDDFYEEETEEQSSYQTVIFVILTLAVLLLAGMYLFRRNIYVLVTGGIILLTGILGTGIWYGLKRRNGEPKEKQREKSEEATDEYLYPEYDTVPEKSIDRKADIKEGMTIVLNENIRESAYLKCMDGMANTIYPIEKEITWIGKRKESVDIWLDIPTISRIHAKIIHKTEGNYIVDLNSRNGTLVNGNYLNPEEEYLLENESSIIFAQVKFLYFSSN